MNARLRPNPRMYFGASFGRNVYEATMPPPAENIHQFKASDI